jgi:hypothetical protein
LRRNQINSLIGCIESNLKHWHNIAILLEHRRRKIFSQERTKISAKRDKDSMMADKSQERLFIRLSLQSNERPLLLTDPTEFGPEKSISVSQDHHFIEEDR